MGKKSLFKVRPLLRYEYKWFIIFFAPALLIELLFTIYPLIENVRLSFGGSELVLDYYEKMASYSRFWNALKVTFLWVVSTQIFTMAFGLLGALLLNRTFRGKTLIMLIMLVPFVTAEWISSIIFKWIYHPLFGILNGMLVQLGLISKMTDIQWLYPNLALISVVISYVWRVGPYLIIIFLGGLQLIPEETYDAAKVDGASAFQTFRYVTLPQLIPIITVSSVILTLWGFGTFNRIYVLTGGGPINVTETLSLLIYFTAFQYTRFELAAAMSNVLFLLVAVFILIYIRLGVKR